MYRFDKYDWSHLFIRLRHIIDGRKGMNVTGLIYEFTPGAPLAVSYPKGQ